eukprot:1202227-Karenia_brevis.AAC.1
MPRPGADNQERNAALIMIYFRPYTLNEEWHMDAVPYLGQMCGSHDTWHNSMLHWFDGNILSEESKRYINNFLAMTRVRPDDDVADAHSDDLISDTELQVEESTFEAAISTRMGAGRKSGNTKVRATSIVADDTHGPEPASEDEAHETTRDSFQRAQMYWQVPDASADLCKPPGNRTDRSQLDKAKTAAKASQKQECRVLDLKEEMSAAVSKQKGYTTKDVKTWLQLIKKRKTETGAPF